LKILHYNSNYLHSPLHSELVNKLEKLQIDNDIIMPRKQNDLRHIKKELFNSNLTIYHNQILTRIDRIFYFNKQRKVKNWVKKLHLNFNNYDLVHAHTLFTDGYQAYKSKIDYIVTVRNTDINYFIRYYKHLHSIGRQILKNAKAIIFLSYSYKQKTINKLFYNKNVREKIKNKSYVVPNGINDYWLENINRDKKFLKKNSINVLFVGRIMKNKNIKFVIEGLKKINTKKIINFYIIGEIIEEKYYENLKDYSNVHFLGVKNKQEIKEIMHEMDIFTMISNNETFGLVYLEALTQKLPVLYTEGEGFDNYFPFGYVGYPVKTNNQMDFIKKFSQILNNYGDIQENIQQIKYQEFSWTNSALKHQKIYNVALEGNN